MGRMDSTLWKQLEYAWSRIPCQLLGARLEKLFIKKLNIHIRSGKNEWNSSQAIYLPESKIKVDGLKEDTRYDVVAVARDGKRYSRSEMLTISTYGMGDSGLNKGIVPNLHTIYQCQGKRKQ